MSTEINTKSNNTEKVKQNEKQESKLKYVLTSDDMSYIKYYVLGWGNEWNTQYSEQQGGFWVGRANLYYLSAALLSKSDRLLHSNNRYSRTVLYGLLKGGWLKHAHKVVNNHHKFMFRNYRHNYKEFDRINHVSRVEEKTPLNKASPWTLVKAFRSQLLASFDSLYGRNMREEPLTLEVENTKKRTRTNKEPEPVRTPEGASFRGRVDVDLINVMYNLMETYNEVLKSTVSLAEYYKYANTLRPNNKKRVYVKRNIYNQEQSNRVRVKNQEQSNRVRVKNQEQRRVNVNSNNRFSNLE